MKRNNSYEEGLKNLKKYSEAKKHIRDYSKNILRDTLIGLVHPYYFQLNQRKNFLCCSHILQDEKDYLTNLKKLFEVKPSSILVFETVNDYFQGTNQLLVDGLIDDVILTFPKSGEIIDKENLEKYSEKDFFMGGGYYGRCLDTVIRQILNLNNSRVYGVKRLCTWPPFAFGPFLLKEDFLKISIDNFLGGVKRFNVVDII